MKYVLISALAAACGGSGLRRGGDPPDPCAGDTTIYMFRDSVRGVTPPVVVRSTLPRGMMGKVTVQGIVNAKGRIESGTIRTFGMGGVEGAGAAGDALFWTQFFPAQLGGCAVRFFYRVTYVAGLPQRIPDESMDTTRQR